MIEVEKINAVLRMQDYIAGNLENDIDIDEVVKVSMYSKRHALRMFKELLALTINEYTRDCRLVRAAKKLVDENNSDNILNVALDAGFDSHEGFTKAFYKYFGVLPQNFKKRDFPKSFVKPTPMSCYYLKLRGCGYPYDNAPMERYYNTLKNELIYQHYYHTDAELYDAIENFAYITYNHVRPHSYNNYKTPFEARCHN